LLGSTHVELGGVQAYVLIPRAKNYSQIHELVKNILDLEIIERKKESIENENARIAVILQQPQSSYRVHNIMNKLGYKVKIESPRSFSFCGKKNALLSFSQERKLFTLDDLADKLETDVTYRTSEEIDYDIVVCLSDEMVDYFEKQNEKEEDENNQAKERSVLDDQGNVLINK